MLDRHVGGEMDGWNTTITVTFHAVNRLSKEEGKGEENSINLTLTLRIKQAVQTRNQLSNRWKDFCIECLSLAKSMWGWRFKRWWIASEAWLVRYSACAIIGRPLSIQKYFSIPSSGYVKVTWEAVTLSCASKRGVFASSKETTNMSQFIRRLGFFNRPSSIRNE